MGLFKSLHLSSYNNAIQIWICLFLYNLFFNSEVAMFVIYSGLSSIKLVPTMQTFS